MSSTTFLLALSVLAIVVLVANIFVIITLKSDKRSIQDSQALFIDLLGHLKGYFSKTQAHLELLEENEKLFNELFRAHQKSQDEILHSLQSNQEVLINKLNKITQSPINNESNSTQDVEDIVIKQTSKIVSMQKQQYGIINEIVKHAIALKDELKEHLTHSAQEAIAKATKSLHDAAHESVQSLNDFDKRALDVYNTNLAKLSSTKNIMHSMHEESKTLHASVDILKKNIIDTAQKSIDLTPVYRALHENIENSKKVASTFDTMHTHMHALLQEIKAHEESALSDVQGSIEEFLEELHESVLKNMRTFKDEMQTTQEHVSKTIKTLSERTQIKNAYSTQPQE